jgi:hypothetical protein
MKSLALLPTLLLVWNCTNQTPSTETTDVTDSSHTAAHVAEDGSEIESVALNDKQQSLDAEDVYGDAGENFQGDYEGDDLSRQDEDGTVRFLNGDSENYFTISLFNENDNAIDDVPAFLEATGITYNLVKTDAEPDSDESTDVYLYTFGSSTIEITYGNVTSATIYSPQIELQDGVKVGMTKKEFFNRFPQVKQYQDTDTFHLHANSFTSACFLTFHFENDKIESIKLEIFIQDCG